MDAQNYKNLYPKNFDFHKILKIHETHSVEIGLTQFLLSPPDPKTYFYLESNFKKKLYRWPSPIKCKNTFSKEKT